MNPEEEKKPGEFSAAVRPTLCSLGVDLQKIYDDTPGSTGPGCCPEAVAAVLLELEEVLKNFKQPAFSRALLLTAAYALQGNCTAEQAADKAKAAVGIK